MGKDMTKTENILTIDDFRNKFEHIDSNKSFYVSSSLCPDKLDSNIYRYVDFAHLVKMIQEKKFFVPNRQRFSDLREHSELHFRSIKELRCMREAPSRRRKKTVNITQDRHSQIWNQAVSCWTYDAHREIINGEAINENYLMWKCHSNKHFVCRIRSSINRFCKSMRDFSHDIIVANIEYMPIERYRTANYPLEIFVKPEFYINEEETRFVVLHNELADCNMSKDIKLQFEPLDMIDEILLSPFINREEDRILRERLKSVLGETEMEIKSSMLMEFSE